MARGHWTNVLYLCFLNALIVQICYSAKSDKVETEDDKLISHLLDTSGTKGDSEGEDSQVSKILKAIEGKFNDK